jgi:hypothetical protein
MATDRAGLTVRRLADKTSSQRVKRYDPITGEAYLADPAKWDATDPSTHQHDPWPFAGLQIDSPPKRTQVSTGWVQQMMSEGLVELEGVEVVHRPGGPAGARWRVTHTFEHATHLVIKTVDGDVRYRVVRNPDKYVTDDHYANGDTDVAWYYELALEG